MKHSIAIILVNWNGLKDTLACIASLLKLNRKACQITVLVVVNGSTDNSVIEIRKKYPSVVVLSSIENRGFAGGNNIGIKYALEHKFEYIWLLNNDTVVDKDAVDMIDAFQDSSVGAVGSKIFFYPGSEFHKDRYTKKEEGKVIWFAGGIIDWNNMIISHRGVDEIDSGQYDTREDTQFITGCSIMVRADTVKKVGLLDESFFLYDEDVDWCIRIQKAGYHTIYWPTSEVWHRNASSSGRPGNTLQEYYMTRNRILIGFRYAPLRTKIALLKESFHFLKTSSKERKNAVVDAFFGNYGKKCT